MALTTVLKNAANRMLEPLNVQIDTLTGRRRETGRLDGLSATGYFDTPVFPIPANVAACDPAPLVARLRQYETRFESFRDPSANDVGYEFANDYFSSPDAETLYAMVRSVEPRTLIEVGSGNSTRIERQAIMDGHLPTTLISIDPSPRLDIESMADEWYRQPVETAAGRGLFDRLQSGDILFIDSSHEIKPGNDCVFLYLRVLPLLPPGVVIHIHDVFLPYEYPEPWVREYWNRPWTEQYLVHSMLTWGSGFQVLWPGYFLQRTCAQFSEWFPQLANRRAQSLWLRKSGGAP